MGKQKKLFIDATMLWKEREGEESLGEKFVKELKEKKLRKKF